MSWLGVMGFEACLESEVEVSVVVAFFKQLPPVVTCLGTIYNPSWFRWFYFHIKSKDRFMRGIVDAVEQWNLADTEAWKFARAYSARRRVERKGLDLNEGLRRQVWSYASAASPVATEHMKARKE